MATRPTMLPRRQTLSNGSPLKPPVLSRTTTSSGQTPISKADACFQALFKGTQKPSPYDAKDPERFYFDLFCLSVDSQTLLSLANEVTDDQLVESGQVKSNVRELFLYAVRCLKICEHDDLRLPNVIEILRTVLRSFLSRALPNYSYDVMHLLAGSLEQADIVFPDFVLGLDTILQNTETSPELRENTMSLALLVVTSINQGSVNSYFLRRDLFSTVIKLTSDPDTAHLAAESFLMLGMLANYHKYAARNAMLVRFEDLVDEGIMKRVREAASTALIQCRDAYVQRMDDSPATFASNIASLMGSFRLLTAPVKHTPANGSASPAGEGSFSDLPLELATILLPIYDLVNSNKAFSSFLLHDKVAETSEEPAFIPALLSLSSYLATHSASSGRTRAYGRLAFIIIVILVEEGAHVLVSNDEASTVRICRQRQPALSPSTTPRPLICSLLDSIVQYIRFNITRKKFDVQTYLLVLRLAHKIMHQLKTARTRISYDWQPLFQSLISLASFLVARQVDLSDVPDIDDLITQVLFTLDFAIVWADVILPDAEAIAQLLYEVLRAETTLSKLGSLTRSVSTPPAITASPRLGPTSPSIRRNSSSGLATPKSPSLASAPTFAAAMSPLEPSGPAADSIRNLTVVSSHFGSKVEDCREKRGGHVVDSRQILSIIKSSMDGLDLRESMALEEVGMRRYSEAEHEAFFAELVPIVAKDILSLSST